MAGFLQHQGVRPRASETGAKSMVNLVITWNYFSLVIDNSPNVVLTTTNRMQRGVQ